MFRKMIRKITLNYLQQLKKDSVAIIKALDAELKVSSADTSTFDNLTSAKRRAVYRYDNLVETIRLIKEVH